jgi:octaprenyl-diphosphate synthase
MNVEQFVNEELLHVNSCIDSSLNTLHPLVSPACRHVIEAGGKRLRPLLTLIFARLFGADIKPLYPVAASVELLHGGTLLHDDILDDSALRRGKPAAHILYGANVVVLAGDAMCALANRLVAEYGNTRCTAILSEALLQTATGEILEISLQRSIEHSHETYLEIIKGKSAWLIRSACEVGAAAAGASELHIEKSAEFGLNLGMGFQIVDDALDFAPSSASTGKPVGGDLKEGKLTPPILYYLETLSEKERQSILTRFTQGTFTDAETAEIAAAIREAGCHLKTYALARTYLEKATACLGFLPPGPEVDLLAKTAEYVGSREN